MADTSLHEMGLRGERLAQGYLRRLEEMSEQARAESAALRATLGDLSAAVRDQSDQVRANTRALLTLLDERGGGPASAGA